MNDLNELMRNPLVWIGGLIGVAVLFGVWHAWRRRAPKTVKKPERTDESKAATLQSVRKTRPRGPADHFDQRFENMVYRTQMGLRGIDAIGLVSLSTVAAATLCFFWKGELWVTLLGAFAGLAIPLVVFRVLSERYHNRLRTQMPDLFYMLARFLRGGLTLPQALQQAENEGLQPISTELSNVNAAVDLGISVRNSLETAARRVQLTDFDAFVSAVTLSQNTGGDLSLVLDRLAAGARDREQFRRQFVAATQSGRITAMLLAAAAPLLILFFFLLDPDRFTSFIQSGFGATTLAIAIALQIIGAIWVFRILRIEY